MKGLVSCSVLVMLFGFALSCGKGCLSCEEGICLACYKRPIAVGKCSPIEYPFDPCIVYAATAQAEVKCSICKQGWLQSQIKGQKLCTLGKIEGCIAGVHDEERGKYCNICDGGFPSKDGTECVNWHSTQKGDLSIPIPVPRPSKNCMWGQRLLGADICFRCNPGFMVVGGLCVKQILEGCLSSAPFGAYCIACDGFNGYYQLENNGRCEKG